MSDHGYYLSPTGEILGPHTPKQLQRFTKSGRITQTTPVRRGEDGPWIAAGRIRSLFPAIEIESYLVAIDSIAASQVDKIVARSSLAERLLADLDALQAEILVPLKAKEAVSELVDFLHHRNKHGYSLVANDIVKCASMSEITTFVGLALASDCVRDVCITTFVDGYVSDAESRLAADILLPLIDRCHARFLKRYARFTNLNGEAFREFEQFFWDDREAFGGSSDSDTWGWGLYFAEYAALKTGQNQLDQYESFVMTPVIEIARLHGVDENEREFIGSIKKWIDQSRAFVHSQRISEAEGRNSFSAKIPVRQASSLTPEETLESAKHDLSKLVGLDSVKQEVSRLMSYLAIQLERRKHGLPESGQTLHYVFQGNPGTGKTTVARILSRVFYGYGVLKSPNLVECDRATLVGGYVGQTAIKTDEVIQSALDGVLFIDEAYTLSSEKGSNDYGREAINSILKKMEDYRSRLIVIVAGYPELMAKFLKQNPGLQSRFTRFIQFEDYDVASLCQIFERLSEEQHFRLTPECRGQLSLLFNSVWRLRDEHFGNARLVRNVFESAQSRHADRVVRLGNIDKAALTTLDVDDVPIVEFCSSANLPRFEDIRWRGTCPECGKDRKANVAALGLAVQCPCGAKFVFPWSRPANRDGSDLEL